MWYHEKVGSGRCPIVDTWWQTETGGHMITPLPGATPTKPGSCTLPLPGIMADDRRRDRAVDVANGQGRHSGHQATLAGDDPHHLGRPGPVQEDLLPGRIRRQALPRRRRIACATRPRRLLHDHGPHRRRAERFGASARHHGDRVGAGCESDGGRGGGRRPARRPDRRGRLRVRRAEAGAAVGRRRRQDRQGAARLGRQGNRPDREAEGNPLRRQPAQDALGQDHAAAVALASPRARRSRRTSRRSRIRRSWSS